MNNKENNALNNKGNLKIKIEEISTRHLYSIDFNLDNGKRLLLIGKTLNVEDTSITINYGIQQTENDFDFSGLITNN